MFFKDETPYRFFGRVLVLISRRIIAELEIITSSKLLNGRVVGARSLNNPLSNKKRTSSHTVQSRKGRKNMEKQHIFKKTNEQKKGVSQT